MTARADAKSQQLAPRLVRPTAKSVLRLSTALHRRWRRLLQAAPFRAAGLGIAISENGRRLLQLKNRYAGRRAFVIGNGPSLRQTDLSKLSGEVTIGSNGIFLLTQEKGFRPTFYTVEDRLVAEDRSSAICQYKGVIKIVPLDLSPWVHPDEDTVYINFVRHPRPFPQFSPAFEQYVCWGGTVTFLNLQLAYYLGIREVYLIGVDHTYHPPARKDEVSGTVVTSRSIDLNHFHPDYFGPGYRWHEPQVERMEVAYREADRFFKKHGRRIVNATVGGQLEVFPRVELEAIVANKVTHGVA